jgi:hypothetical protein
MVSELQVMRSNEEDLVEIKGRVYSRHLANLLAQDIQVLTTLAPNSWAVGDNSALTIGRTVALSMATPIKHGVLVDMNALDEAGKAFVLSHTTVSPPAEDLVSVQLGHWTSADVELLREGHASAIRQLTSTYTGKCRIWRWLNDGRLQDLEAIVGHQLPKPAYFNELLDIRTTEADSPVLAGSDQPGRPESLFPYVVKAIRAAHQVNPNSWSIYNVKSGLTLSISGYSALFIANERADLLLDGTPDDPDYVTLASIRKNTNFNAPVFRLLLDRRTQLIEYIDLFQESFLSAIRTLAATTRTVTPRQAEFQPRLLRYIEEQTGISLPIPEYFDNQLSESGLVIKTPEKVDHGESLRAMEITNFIQQALAIQGLKYDDHQITAFYTALQTKGFVVLSGISGTGKSKIATGFVSLLPEASSAAETPVTSGETIIQIPVRRTTKNSGLINFPIRKIESFPVPRAGESIRVQVYFDGISHSCLLHHIADRGSLYRLYFSGEVRKRLVKLPLNTTLYIRTIVDEDAMTIAGFDISVESFLRVDPISIDDILGCASSQLFMSVRPDWRDSTSLLGYYNPLTSSYEWTDFLKFILRAVDNYKEPEEKRIAWFVILDEMNLAHVEYYFADLLSVIESGRDADGWTSEPLRFTYPETLDDEVPPREVKLPPNLYFIGTVNMDETTHAFSPKVLDRAFTIELTDVDFMDYPPTPAPNGTSTLDDATKQDLLCQFSRNGKFARIDKGEIADFVQRHDDVRQSLQHLNTALARFRMHFGYRVFDEIVQYLANNEANNMESREAAFDQAVLMKVLPKFTGSRARLEDPLRAVLTWALDPTGIAEEETQGLLQHWSPGDDVDTILQAGSCKRVARKVADMLWTLERDGFVSFG